MSLLLMRSASISRLMFAFYMLSEILMTILLPWLSDKWKEDYSYSRFENCKQYIVTCCIESSPLLYGCLCKSACMFASVCLISCNNTIVFKLDNKLV